MKRLFITALAICGILFSSYSLADPPSFYKGSDKESFQKFKSRYLEILLVGDDYNLVIQNHQTQGSKISYQQF